jgi:23S rRNA pseudouridine1911/1915/1917 synthase
MRHKKLEIPEIFHGKRADIAISELLGNELSRNQVKDLIKSGDILINDERCKPKDKIRHNDQIDVSIPDAEVSSWTAEDINLDIIFACDDYAIINKPAGLVMHPGAGVKSGTLANAVAKVYPEVLSLPRNGIVHRLDKDTSGLVVIARKNGFRNHIAEQFQNREVEKKYLAVIKGEIIGALTIDKPIARDRQNRTKMKVDESGREAISKAISLESFGGYSVVEVKIETGRTHQIRVHLSSNKTPIIGDKAYGSGSQLIKNLSDNLKDKILSFPRQALHAYQLAFLDASNEMQTYKSNPPDDILGLIESLKSNENA